MMSCELMISFWGWCSVINLGLLMIWFVMFRFAHDWIYTIHSRWFELSVTRFDSIHYAGMTFFKLFIFIFFLTPYLVLKYCV